MVATPSDRPWREAAACAQSDPELFFTDQPAQQAQALAVCAGCPVRDACLRDALTNARLYGVWGGLTETERRALLGLKPRRRPAQDVPRPSRPKVERQRRPDPTTGVRVDCGCGAESCPGKVCVKTRRLHRKAAGLPPVVVERCTAAPVDCECGLPGCRGRVSRRTRWRHQRQVAELAQVAA
jgi:WhiB family transcriptional regulator, redox-sensing transcriptional regulator